MAVERDITWNIRHFQGALRCDRNFDVVYRVFRICGREACMFFVDGFAKDEIMEKLLEFFYGIQDEDLLRDAHQSRVSPTVRWPSAGRRTPSWGRYCLEYGRCSWMEWTSAC